MFQDFSNHFRVFDGSDDFHSAAAFGTSFDVNAKDPCEQSCPGNVFLLLVAAVHPVVAGEALVAVVLAVAAPEANGNILYSVTLFLINFRLVL